jgi:beta-xylosidase
MIRSRINYPWRPDLGDGTYANPVIHADYSDPDVIRVGDDFWMTASSFNCAPGLPILHSRDLVNWRLVNHAIHHVPHSSYHEVRVGCGVWAPSIRYHSGKFWIVFPMPDEGIYVTCAEDPAGRWEEPWCLAEAKGWIDPCLYWDDDGLAYLVHAYAFSRSGLKERIHLRPMSPDARSLLGEGRELFHTPHHLYLEGPKVHKFDGWYYILCPGGGVQNGWQVAFRSRQITGPYEEKIILEQGNTTINGPHQGALVDDPDGQWWFMHFQDKGVFGRVTHLQPVVWVEGWPLCGEPSEDGRCQPVSCWTKPVQGQALEEPATSDDFASPLLGLQWQWQANHDPDWFSLVDRPGFMRLFPGCGSPLNLFRFPRLLAQKIPAENFVVESLVDVAGAAVGTIAGLAVIGGDRSHFIALRRTEDGADYVLGTPEGWTSLGQASSLVAELAVCFNDDGSFRFNLPSPGSGQVFSAGQGGWIGAKVGLFHLSENAASAGHADFGYFQFS